MVQLGAHVGVQQCLVPFTPAPEDVVLAAKFLRRVHAGLHGRGGIGEDVGIGVGRCPAHPTAVSEHIGGAPEQLDAGGLHFDAEKVGDFVQPGFGFGKAVAFGAHVEVVEAEVGRAENFEQLKGDVGLQAGGSPSCRRTRGARRFAPPKGSPPGQAKAVPIGDGKAEVVGLGFALDVGSGVVVAKRQWIGTFGPFVFDRGNVVEKSGGHCRHSVSGRIIWI